MQLHPSQFKAALVKKSQAAYDKRGDKILAYMEKRGESTKIGMEQQMANWDKVWKSIPE